MGCSGWQWGPEARGFPSQAGSCLPSVLGRCPNREDLQLLHMREIMAGKALLGLFFPTPRVTSMARCCSRVPSGRTTICNFRQYWDLPFWLVFIFLLFVSYMYTFVQCVPFCSDLPGCKCVSAQTLSTSNPQGTYISMFYKNWRLWKNCNII